MSKITLSIDGVQIKATKGEKLLWAALDAGIYIPNLCAIRERKLPFGSCRLCWVEIEGEAQPVTSCTIPVKEGMRIYTRTPRVLRLVRTAFELLIAHHPVDCVKCAKNKSCELQKIARHFRFKLKPGRLRKLLKELPVDSSHPCFILDPNKCVLCGKCVWVCSEQQGIGALDFAFRGLDTVITTFGGEPLSESSCNSCRECISVCPVGALIAKSA